MAYIREEKINNSISAITEEGITVNLSQEQKVKTTYFNVQEMNGRYNDMELFNVLGEVAKSGKDNKLVGQLIMLANTANEIHMHNMTEFAKEQKVSVEAMKKLLARAVEHDLLYKVTTGHYILNPYIIMSKGLTSAGYEAQELAQLRWREVTGLLTNKQIAKLVNLTHYLKLPTVLYATEFNLSVAEYYHSKGTITDKQKVALRVSDVEVSNG